MIVRAALPSDRDELIRMRIALWPDSTTEEAVGFQEVQRNVCFRRPPAPEST